jgi:pimeloyl-ACP methyl ester carboxylesterase
MTSPEVLRYEERGRLVRVGAYRVFAFESEPPSDKPTILALHGFPTSSFDFQPVVGITADRYRWVTFDYVGFGLSDKPAGIGYSIFEYADDAEVVVRELGVTECHLFGHDLGTSVACELVARRERGLSRLAPRSLTLMNGSVHIELSQLTVSQRALLSPLGPVVARLGTRRIFFAQMKRVFGRPVADRELELLWELCERADGQARLPDTIAYVRERRRFAERWVGTLGRLDLPVHLLWGVLDPVAVMAIPELLSKEIPKAELTRLEGIGHYPQVEAPEETARELVRFFAQHDASPSGSRV